MVARTNKPSSTPAPVGGGTAGHDSVGVDVLDGAVVIAVFVPVIAVEADTVPVAVDSAVAVPLGVGTPVPGGVPAPVLDAVPVDDDA